MPLNEEDLCELSREDLAKIIARLKGEIPTTVDLPDNSFVVPALQSQIVYSEDVPNVFRMKAHIVAWSDTLLKYKSFDIDMSYVDGVAKDSISSKLQNGLNMPVVFDKVGTKIQLSVINNENESIQVRIKRLDYVNV